MSKCSKEVIYLIFNNVNRAIPFNIIVGILLAIELYHMRMPLFLAGIWLSILAIITAIRWFFCRHIIKLSVKEIGRQHLYYFTLLTFMTGATWGACYWLMLPDLSEAQEFILILILGGMCAGGVASLSVYLPAYLSYTLPMFLPVIAYNYWLFNIDRVILSTMLLLFLVFMIILARTNGNLLNRTFKLSRRNEKLVRNLKRLVVKDSLTKLYNRRYFNSTLRKEIFRAKRNYRNLIVVSIDIDNFKMINDCFGHPQGDEFLIQTSDVLRGVFRRASDMIFRLGGDEFCVLLTNQKVQEALELGKRLQSKFKIIASHLPSTTAKEFNREKITLSMGVAFIPYTTTPNFEKIVSTADHALYQAKYSGKNRIVLADKDILNSQSN